ncbi:MAG: tRNA(His) guanylyltransferase Thg1 family protein [Polyangiales bacterium]
MESLEDRMKSYEGVEAGRRLDGSSPVVARVDGRSFSSFTRSLAKPFDARLSRLMIETARHLVRESGASIAYTQSDEISLVWWLSDPKAQLWFGARVQKMCSQLAAQATAAFNHLLPEAIPEKFERRSLESLPTFDARVWGVPSLSEAVNVLVWREQDAIRNSVEMAARSRFSHSALHEKSQREMLAMLREVGVEWDEYPAFFKRGTYLQRRVSRRRFSVDEIESLPAKHAARSDPALEVERTDIIELAMEPLVRVRNREGVVFRGEDPLLESE